MKSTQTQPREVKSTDLDTHAQIVRDSSPKTPDVILVDKILINRKSDLHKF